MKPETSDASNAAIGTLWSWHGPWVVPRLSVRNQESAVQYTTPHRGSIATRGMCIYVTEFTTEDLENTAEFKSARYMPGMRNQSVRKHQEVTQGEVCKIS